MKDVTEVLLFLAGVALISMLVKNADNSATLFKGFSDAYGGLLKAATLDG